MDPMAGIEHPLRELGSIELRGDRAELPRLLEWVRSVIAAAELPPQRAYALEFATEELGLNALSYAYPEGATGPVAVAVAALPDGAILLRIVDAGIPYDPTARPDAAVDAPLEERGVGGLGVHLVRRLATSMRYRREEGRNVLEVSL
jgi:anti-sigma regulatory factor (Ser/Thr protein kinase)